jgi:hypothetical protein
MSALRVIMIRPAGGFGRARRDAALSEEIESHLELLAAAHRRRRARFGSIPCARSGSNDR